MNVLNIYHLPNRCVPETAHYIGRRNTKLGLEGSIFANPFAINDHDDRDAVVTKYGQWLWRQVTTGVITLDHLVALEGKDLVCFCAPKRCHGDVLKNAVVWARKCLNGELPRPTISPPEPSAPQIKRSFPR